MCARAPLAAPPPGEGPSGYSLIPPKSTGHAWISPVWGPGGSHVAENQAMPFWSKEGVGPACVAREHECGTERVLAGQGELRVATWRRRVPTIGFAWRS